MLKNLPLAICAVCLSILPAHLVRAAAWDLARDWSDVSNPNGAWSYNNSLGPITVHQSAWAPHNPIWSGQDAWALAASGSGHIVAWLKSDRNLGGEYDLAVGDVNTHTWDGFNGAAGTGNLSVVKWTAPTPGAFHFSGGVWQAVRIGRSAAMAVYVDGVLHSAVAITDGSGFARRTPFAFGAANVQLNAGESIELQFATTSAAGTHIGVNLTVATADTGLPGDYDRDGDVDGGDMLVWQRNVGSTVAEPGIGADGNHNGRIDSQDLTVWRAHFGRPAVGSLNIPEPVSCASLAMVFALIVVCARGTVWRG